MKKIGFAAIVASGLGAAVVGLAAPASADVSHHMWVHQMHQKASAPHVDTTPKHTAIRTNR